MIERDQAWSAIADSEPATEVSAGRSLIRWVTWLALTLPLFAYLAFGQVTVTPLFGFAEHIRIATVWRDLRGTLPEVGRDWLLAPFYWLALVVFLGGFLLAVWIALTPDARQVNGLADPE